MVMMSCKRTNFFVVWTVVALNKPGWFGIRNFVDFALYFSKQFGLFPIYNANLETLVLRTFENFVTMKTEEGFGCVLARW